MIKIIICDDDLSFSNKVQQIVAGYFKEAVIDQYNDAKKLALQEQKYYDVAFLDVEMPGSSGFELAQHLYSQNENICIIFISNLEEKVYESLKYRPLRFIRKSVLEEEIDEAMMAVKDTLQNDSVYIEFTDTEKRVRHTRIDDIIYFESNKHYINVVTKKESFVIRENMSVLDVKYSTLNFVRIQIGFLVNMKYIQSINGYSLQLDNGKVISIGRSNLQRVKEKYMNYVRSMYVR